MMDLDSLTQGFPKPVEEQPDKAHLRLVERRPQQMAPAPRSHSHLLWDGCRCRVDTKCLTCRRWERHREMIAHRRTITSKPEASDQVRSP